MLYQRLCMCLWYYSTTLCMLQLKRLTALSLQLFICTAMHAHESAAAVRILISTFKFYRDF